MQNNIAYLFDEKENKFITISKTELINNIIRERMNDIEYFYEELKLELDEMTKKKIDDFLYKIENDDKYKELKKSQIKIILYNNRNMITMIKKLNKI
jgi:hypothetical protein